MHNTVFSLCLKFFSLDLERWELGVTYRSAKYILCLRFRSAIVETCYC